MYSKLGVGAARLGCWASSSRVLVVGLEGFRGFPYASGSQGMNQQMKVMVMGRGGSLWCGVAHSQLSNLTKKCALSTESSPNKQNRVKPPQPPQQQQQQQQQQAKGNQEQYQYFRQILTGEEEKEQRRQKARADIRRGLRALVKSILAMIPIVIFVVSLFRGYEERNRWIEVQAVVVPHSVSLLKPEDQERKDGDPITSSYITYRYQLGNRLLQKTQVRSPFWSEMGKLLPAGEKTYNAGEKVAIKCKPEDPTFTCIDPLIFSWWSTDNSKNNHVATFIDGKPTPGKAQEKRPAREPFKGRTAPPKKEELQKK